MIRYKIIILILFLVVIGELTGRTRDEVIKEAEKYKEFEWKVGSDNILDIVNNQNTNIKEPDGYDDRGGWPYSTNNWPYRVGHKYTGEAYAYGGYSDWGSWGADTPERFENKLKTTGRYANLSRTKWIAGARRKDVGPQGQKTIMPDKYAGFAGIECIGFINNIYQPPKRVYATKRFEQVSIHKRELSEMRVGDVFVRPGSPGHILVFAGW